jgi:HK97 family phage prohead protease
MQLPAYIQHVANRLRAQGHPESQAVHMAVGIVQDWAAGHDGHGNAVSADVQAAAVKAVAEWEALRAAAHASSSGRSAAVADAEYRAPMAVASMNDLPDSAFAYIQPGGTKDASGKTTPRSLRHFPVHDAAHVRNALARAPQSPFGDKAMPKIKAAAEKLGVQAGDSDGDSGSRAVWDQAERRVTPAVMEIRTAAGGTHIGGYGAVFGKLSRNLGGFVELVGTTAFNQSRQLGWPGVRCRLNHDKNQLLGTTEGRTLALRTDNIGLDYEVEPPPSMRHVVEWVERGDMRSSSFAFNCPSGGDEWRTSDQGYPLRILHEVQLLDVAPVTENEAYADATVGLRSLARTMDAPFEEVRALAAEDELRRFFVRTDNRGPSRPKPPPITGPAAMMRLMDKRRDPWADQDV